MREVLLQERQEDGGRTGLQEKRVGKNVVGSRVGGCADQRFEIGWGVSNPRHNRRATDTDAQSGLRERTDGIEAEVRPWRARLKNARESDIQSSDSYVDREAIRLRNFFE